MQHKHLGPLTDADYRRLNEELTRSEHVRQQIDLAIQAGFPCEDQDRACQAIRDQLSQIKRTYFPDRP